VSPELVFQQALNGLSFGALLFILASGLSLVFGMMDVVNLAHGAFYMLGAYVALSVVQFTGSFWLALLVAPLALALLGLVLEPLLLRRLRGRHLDQVLLTIGVSLVIVDVIGQVWGREVRSLSAPAGLDGSVALVGGVYPVYRLFVIGFGAALAAAMAVVYRRTKIGMLIRAGVEDAQMLMNEFAPLMKYKRPEPRRVIVLDIDDVTERREIIEYGPTTSPKSAFVKD